MKFENFYDCGIRASLENEKSEFIHNSETPKLLQRTETLKQEIDNNRMKEEALEKARGWSVYSLMKKNWS